MLRFNDDILFGQNALLPTWHNVLVYQYYIFLRMIGGILSRHGIAVDHRCIDVSMHITIKTWWRIARRKTRKEHVYETRAKSAREGVAPLVACKHQALSPSEENEPVNAGGDSQTQFARPNKSGENGDREKKLYASVSSQNRQHRYLIAESDNQIDIWNSDTLWKPLR